MTYRTGHGQGQPVDFGNRQWPPPRHWGSPITPYQEKVHDEALRCVSEVGRGRADGADSTSRCGMLFRTKIFVFQTFHLFESKTAFKTILSSCGFGWSSSGLFSFSGIWRYPFFELRDVALAYEVILHLEVQYLQSDLLLFFAFQVKIYFYLHKEFYRWKKKYLY